MLLNGRFRCTRDVPDSDRMVFGGGENIPAVRCKTNRGHGPGVSSENRLLNSAITIPDTNRPIPMPRNYVPFVPRSSNCEHGRRSAEAAHFRAAFHIPNNDVPIIG